MTDTKIKPAIFLAENEERILRKASLPENRNLARESVPMYDESALEAARQEGRDEWTRFCSQFAAENDQLRAKLKLAMDALTKAVNQNEHDMLLTGEECREIRETLAKIKEEM